MSLSGKRSIDSIVINYDDDSVWSYGNEKSDHKTQVINLTGDEHIVRKFF